MIGATRHSDTMQKSPLAAFTLHRNDALGDSALGFRRELSGVEVLVEP